MRGLVPFDVVVGVSEPIVGRKVDDFDPGGPQRRHGSLRLEMRQREEHDIGDVDQPVRIQIVEGEIA